MSREKITVKNDEYLYSSSRVRALESYMLDMDKCKRLCDAKSHEDLFRALGEMGIKLDKSDYEAVLDNKLKEAYSTLEKISPQKELTDILKYTYDCHNIKSAIKSEIKGSNTEDLFIDLGSINAETLEALCKNRIFNSFPKNMAKAAEEAIEAYSKTKDPQLIDVILDRACYKDMYDLAKCFNNAFINGVVERKADLCNILTALRIIRANNSELKYSYFEQMMIKDTGKLAQSFFADVFAGEDKESVLAEKLKYTDYKHVGEALENESVSLASAERFCDDCFMQYIKNCKTMLCGPEVLLSYLYAEESEVKNLRIIIAGKLAGLDGNVIKERLRLCYV